VPGQMALPHRQHVLALPSAPATLEGMTSPDRRPPRTADSEREVLLGFLDYLRDCVVEKVSGVAEPAVREAGVASGTNLLGLVKHLTYVERFHFLGESAMDWAATFHAGPEETAEAVLSAYRGAVQEANAAIDACADLSSAAARPGRSPVTMRWALTHMVEETARHAGHMDILRELIDGSTGR